MALFLISYELRKSDFNYHPLYDALAEIDAKHVQDSVWGVNTTSTVAELFNFLWQHMHNGKDRLLVVTFDKSLGYSSHNAITRLKDL